MTLRPHMPQLIHEEHVATLDLLAQLAQAIRAPRTAKDAALPRFRDLLRSLVTDLEDTVERHFVFEERHLFPLLRKTGHADLVEALTREHAAIRNATAPLLRHLRDALAADPAEQEWASVGRLGLALIEMKQAHMQREETEMVPLLQAFASAGQPGP